MTESGLSPLPVRHVAGERRPAPFPELGAKDEAPPPVPPEVDRMRELEAMLREAQGRAELIEKEAYDKAWQAGEKAGLELGRERARQILEQMQAMLEETEHALQRMRADFSEAVVDVAEALARRVVGDLLEDAPERLADIAARCAGRLPETDALVVAVAPADAAMFEKVLGQELAEARIVADERVRPGSCKIMAREHDVLVDADEAIRAGMQAIRAELLSPVTIADRAGT